MDAFDRSRVPDAALLHNFLGNAGHERRSTATVVADIGEIDERKLYLPAGYPSMFAYCVAEAHYSESSAYKRIQVARTARRFPQIFPALADGRLNLTGILLLRPHLTVANASELPQLAEWKRNAEIERLIADRFPRTELLPLVSAAPMESPERDAQLAARLVAGTPAGDPEPSVSRATLRTPVAPAPPPKVTPIATERVGWQFSSGRALHDKYRRAQELMNCSDIEQVLDAALDLLNEKLAKQKCGAASRPRTGPAPKSQNPRHIPSAVRRGLEAGQESVLVCERLRPPVRGQDGARARPHRTRRPRRHRNAGQRAAALSCAQPACCRMRVRSGVHEREARDRAAERRSEPWLS